MWVNEPPAQAGAGASSSHAPPWSQGDLVFEPSYNIFAVEAPSRDGHLPVEVSSPMAGLVLEDADHHGNYAPFFPTFNETVRGYPSPFSEGGSGRGTPTLDQLISAPAGQSADPLQSNDPWAGQRLPRDPYANPRGFRMTPDNMAYAPSVRPSGCLRAAGEPEVLR